MGTISIDAAVEAHAQAARDLTEAIDTAMTSDRVADRLAMSIALQAMRYVEAHGLTDAGRTKLKTGIEAARTVLEN